MKYRTFTVTETLQALAVEIIRRLWGQGRCHNIEWLQRVHDNWFDIWVDWRTDLTMRDVDRQAEELTPPPEIIKPLYWEEEEGETPLGGPLGYTYQFDDAPSGADSVQRPE